MSAFDRTAIAASRLPNVPPALLARMLDRDLAACEEAAALCQAAWRDSDEAKPIVCVDPLCIEHGDGGHACETTRMAGPLLVALWHARDYEDLARAGAPASDAWPCSYGPAGVGCSNGSGIVYGRGYTENGVFKGSTYTCPRCHGKGWMSKADKARCKYHDDRFVVHV